MSWNTCIVNTMSCTHVMLIIHVHVIIIIMMNMKNTYCIIDLLRGGSYDSIERVYWTNLRKLTI